MDIKLSDAEKIFLIHGAEAGFRNDGRGCEDFRPIIVERGALSSTDGSARVRLDTTDILVGVKCDLQFFEDGLVPDSRLRFSVDCSANASPQFEGKGGDLFAEDIVSMLEAVYDNSYILPDIKKLQVSPNHCWIIYVDIVILQYGGNIADACSIGTIAALNNTQICVVNPRPADANRMTIELPDSGETWSLNIEKLPILITVSKVGTANIVDCCTNEEACVKSALVIGVSPPPKPNSSNDSCIISLVRQTAGGSLENQSAEDMIDTAVRVSRGLHKSLRARFAEEESSEELRLPGETFLS
ncbi:unnamed protein product [Auanema sp. JU1783]|nr:unnamed protein product [Auanema sp. JU1783]